MTLDRGLHVLGEVRIDSRRGVLGKQCDAFGDGAAKRFRGMKNSNGPRVIFDDDFSAGAHSCEERRNVGGSGLRFRDANHILGHIAIVHPTGSKRILPLDSNLDSRQAHGNLGDFFAVGLAVFDVQLDGILDVRESFFVSVALAVTALQRRAENEKAIGIGLDDNRKDNGLHS